VPSSECLSGEKQAHRDSGDSHDGTPSAEMAPLVTMRPVGAWRAAPPRWGQKAGNDPLPLGILNRELRELTPLPIAERTVGAFRKLPEAALAE